MVFVAELAFARGLIDATVLELHRNLLKRFDLPIAFQRDAWQKLAPLLALDKKARGTKIRFVALDGIGATVRLDDLSSSELDAAYERISS
jgi:3-dehydroquinate synthase